MKIDCSPSELIELLLNTETASKITALTSFIKLEFAHMTQEIDQLKQSEAAEDASNQQLRDAVTALLPAVTTLVQNNQALKTALENAIANSGALSEADKASAQAIIDANVSDVAKTQAVLAGLSPVAQSVSDANTTATISN